MKNIPLSIIIILILCSCNFKNVFDRKVDQLCIVYNVDNSCIYYNSNKSIGPFYYIDDTFSVHEETKTKNVLALPASDFEETLETVATDFSSWHNINFFLYKNSESIGSGYVSGEQYYTNPLTGETISTLQFSTNVEKKDRYIAYTKKVNPCKIINYGLSEIKENAVSYYKDSISKLYQLPTDINYIVINFVGDIDADDENEVFVTLKKEEFDDNLYVYFIAELDDSKFVGVKWINYYKQNYYKEEFEIFFDVIDIDNDGQCEVFNSVGPYYQESVSLYRIQSGKLKLIKKSFLITTS